MTMHEPNKTNDQARHDEVLRLYRMDVVYPGHPCLIAMQIMANFPTYNKAKQPVKEGWPSALSCNAVKGAGGAVYSGLAVVRQIDAKPHELEEAFERGCEIWNDARQSDHPDQREAGNQKAQEMKEDFMLMARRWLKAQGVEVA